MWLTMSMAEPAFIPPLPPMIRCAKMPRSWLCSLKRMRTRFLVFRSEETKMGTLGEVSVVLSGRRILVRLRDVRRSETMLRIASGHGELVR